jgi:hypothetical protein
MNYTEEKEKWTKNEKGIKEKGGWWKLPDQRLFVPSAVAAPLVKKQHELTYWEKYPWKNCWTNAISFPNSSPCAPK